MIHSRIEFHKMVNGRLEGRFAISESVAAAVEQLLRDKGRQREHHANCRPVMICEEPDMNVYGLRMDNHGAKPITDWWFASADVASQHMGYRHNAVAQALYRAKKRGETNASVGGVLLGYADKVLGID